MKRPFTLCYTQLKILNRVFASIRLLIIPDEVCRSTLQLPGRRSTNDSLVIIHIVEAHVTPQMVI